MPNSCLANQSYRLQCSSSNHYIKATTAPSRQSSWRSKAQTQHAVHFGNKRSASRLHKLSTHSLYHTCGKEGLYEVAESTDSCSIFTTQPRASPPHSSGSTETTEPTLQAVQPQIFQGLYKRLVMQPQASAPFGATCHTHCCYEAGRSVKWGLGKHGPLIG